ncbi:MAG: hypothetical protein QXH07_05360 [Thermoplasmata archaeon]
MENLEIIEIEENYPRFDEFYRLYSTIFTKKEEIETEENLKKYLSYKKTGYYGKNDYHILLLLNKSNDIIGFLIGDFYSDPGISFIEFLGIDKKYRDNGFSKILFNKFLKICENDALISKSKLNGVIIEVEKPEVIDSPGSFTYWDKLGFKKIECKYIQPSLSINKESEKNLMLMYYGISEKYLKKETLVSALKAYFKYAMSKEEPDDLDELKILDESIKNYYVTLTKLGSAWFVHPHIHYFSTFDILGISKEKIESIDKKLNKILSGIVSIGSYKLENEVDDETMFRIERDRIDFSEKYLEKRYIMRGKLNLELPEFVMYAPYDATGLMEKIPADIDVFCSFNSIGTLTIDVNVKIKTTLTLGSLIYLENSRNVYIYDKRIEDFIKEIINKMKLLDEKELIMKVYPFIFVTEYGGKLSYEEIYGITEMDPSYWQVSKMELLEHKKKDISIVKDIMAYYEYNASMVASKSKNVYIENLEEIAGIQFSEVKNYENVEEKVLLMAESEYVVEIERLRIQYMLLYSLLNLLENKNVTRKYSLEYAQLLDIEKRLVRKMDEIELTDTEHFASLKMIFKDSQDRLGITELKRRVVTLENNIKEEIQIRSEITQVKRTNALNILIFLLILIQIVEPFFPRNLQYIIFIIVIVSAFVLFYSFLQIK